MTTERDAESQQVVVRRTWPLRIIVALVILIGFLAILLVVSSLYPTRG